MKRNEPALVAGDRGLKRDLSDGTFVSNRQSVHPGPHLGLLVLIAVVTLLGLASCSPFSKTTFSEGPGVGRRAPDFQIVVYQGGELLGGQELKFSRILAQKKPVVLNFWAGLCPPCRAEMPDLQKVHDQYKDRITLFGLDVGPFVGLGTREDGQALLRELAVTFPTGTTFDAEVVRRYGVLGMPTTYFIMPNGKILRQWTGLMNKSKMTELVEQLLAAAEAL